jgi:hypothetical protein
VAQSRVLFFGLAAIYLLGIVVQFFLAGMGAFGATDYDAHRSLGFILGIGSLALLAFAVVGRVPRLVFLLTVLLVGLNVLQILLANVDVEEIAALHPVNALLMAFVAYGLATRSRRDLTEKIAA